MEVLISGKKVNGLLHWVQELSGKGRLPMTEQERKIEALIQCVGQEVFERHLEKIPQEEKKTDIQDVGQLMTSLGIPTRLLGYDYLVTAINYYIENPRTKITKDIYPVISERYSTTCSGVERCIRHAICTAWDRGDVEILNRIFGNTISRYRGTPTNGEFIDTVARMIRRNRERS